MKTILKEVVEGDVRYQALMFVCPGCQKKDPSHTGILMIPVNTDAKSPSWHFDGNVNFPTLTPSIITTDGDGHVCHAFLKEGVMEFLSDSTHSLANSSVPIPDLPEWITKWMAPE